MNTGNKTNLQKLFEIPKFGRQLFNGGHYQIKFRIPDESKSQVEQLKKKYPEMIVHAATTGFIIFGGTFPQKSEFLNDCKRILKIDTP